MEWDDRPVVAGWWTSRRRSSCTSGITIKATSWKTTASFFLFLLSFLFAVYPNLFPSRHSFFFSLSLLYPPHSLFTSKQMSLLVSCWACFLPSYRIIRNAAVSLSSCSYFFFFFFFFRSIPCNWYISGWQKSNGDNNKKKRERLALSLVLFGVGESAPGDTDTHTHNTESKTNRARTISHFQRSGERMWNRCAPLYCNTRPPSSRWAQSVVSVDAEQSLWRGEGKRTASGVGDGWEASHLFSPSFSSLSSNAKDCASSEESQVPPLWSSPINTTPNAHT